MPGGRPRKPTALRIIEGNRSHAPMPKGEPQPVVGVPDLPELVAGDELAARYWQATAGVLGAVPGWVAHDMVRQLTDYALLQARRDRLYLALRTNDEVYEAEYVHEEGKDNEVLVKSRKPQPEAKILEAILKEIRQLEVAMGIGPVFRAKIDLSGHGDGEDDVLHG